MRTCGSSASLPIYRLRSRYSRTLHRETCKPRAAPAGGRRHPGEVRSLRTPCLPDCGQHRGTQRYASIVRADEDALTRAIISLASQYGRYGYRRITSLLAEAGWQVGCDRVQRIWRREGLKVPRKQRPRGRLWLNDGSCIRLRPQHRNHVWSYDFVEAQTHDGRKVRLMTLIDEFTRECLAIRVARRINSFGVIETMADMMLERGVPEHIRSDNGAEMTAKSCVAGSQSSEQRRSTSSPAAHGRTAIANPSTASCATSASMEKSSTA